MACARGCTTTASASSLRAGRTHPAFHGDVSVGTWPRLRPGRFFFPIATHEQGRTGHARPRRFRAFLPLPMNHRITFPSVHAMGGTPFVAEVSAPTPDLAVREVLEHCAREGIALEYLRLHDIQDLKGARLDDLKLSNCKLSSVNLSGASLTGVHIEHCTFAKVVADHSTRMDRSMLDGVTFEDCALNGASLKAASLSGLRFEFTEANALDLEGASIDGLRSIR